MTAPLPDVVNWNEIDSTPGPPDYSQGPPGPTGPAGPQGPIGPPGEDGQEGIQGDQGIPGAGWKVMQISPADGSNTGDPLGTIWYNSVTGQFWTLINTTPYTWRLDGTVVGAQGNTGPQGPAGPTGAPGPTGNTGPAGPQGVQGVPGPQGIQGPTGPQGATGPQGNTGPAGGAGAQGPVGPSSSVHEEFLPTNGATTVTLSQTPQWILMVARAGVVQSQTDGNYSLSASTITFTDAFNGAERVIVDYASTGYTPVPPLSGAGIADGSITSLQIQDGAIATADLADRSVTNAKLGTDTARLNLLVNGGFEIWQRGNGPFTNGWTADRWSISLAGTDAMSVSVDGSVPNNDIGSQFAAAATYTRNTGGSVLEQNQSTEGIVRLRGRTISFSARVKCSTANAVRLRIYDGAATYSSYHTGSGSFETLTVTRALATSLPSLLIGFIFDASCTAYLDNAMLVVGSVPADYAPLHPADDLARCLRYYEVVGEGSWVVVGETNPLAGGTIKRAFGLKARKALTPTITKVGTWFVSNCGQPVIVSPSVDGLWLQIAATSAGIDTYSYNNTTGSMYLTVESNP